jgi:hypothetical protein
LELVELVEGEVGEPVEIETPVGKVRATWLGTVGADGWDLTQACKLMIDMAKERSRQQMKNQLSYGHGKGVDGVIEPDEALSPPKDSER